MLYRIRRFLKCQFHSFYLKDFLCNFFHIDMKIKKNILRYNYNTYYSYLKLVINEFYWCDANNSSLHKHFQRWSIFTNTKLFVNNIVGLRNTFPCFFSSLIVALCMRVAGLFFT